MTKTERIRQIFNKEGIPNSIRGFAAKHHKEFNTSFESMRNLTRNALKNTDTGRRGIENAAEEHGIDVPDMRGAWLKSGTSSVFIKNPDFEDGDEHFDLDSVDWSGIVDAAKTVNIEPQPKVIGGGFDRLVYTDTHIGMTPDIDGHALYGGSWEEDDIMSTCHTMIQAAVDERKSNKIIVDDLGDFLDGWGGQTARKGHDLDQCMDNAQMFDVGLRFKITLANGLYPYFDEIIFNNITLDNHAATFGYIVNSAFGVYCENALPNVTVTNHRRFINHYKVGSRVFIISHGKDDKNLKFGFKKMLDEKGEKKINNYIDEHFLWQKGVEIEFSKGDTHQMVFDDTTAERFSYYSYPALSPSSNWVQTNFQKGKRGFFFFNYFKNNKHVKPYYFK